MFSFQPLFLSLTLAGFSSVFEVFVGLGFAFYGLSQMEALLNETLSAEIRESEKSLLREIDDCMMNAESCIESAIKSGQILAIFMLGQKKTDLLELRSELTEGKMQLVYNSRYYFFYMGIHALLLLLFCGCEATLATTEGHAPQFYGSLLFANIFFLAIHGFITLWTFHDKQEVSSLVKLLLTFALCALSVLIGAIVCCPTWLCVEWLVGISIIGLLLPFPLLLYRYKRFERFLRVMRFGPHIREINAQLLGIQASLPTPAQQP